MRIIFIRHGDPDYVNDTLTEKGIVEAKLLAERVAKWENIDEIYCSPLGRASKTASYSLEKLGRTAITKEWMQEFSYNITDPTTGEVHVPWDLMPEYWTKHEELYHPEKWLDNDIYSSNPDIRVKYKEVAEGIDEILEGYGYHRNGRYYVTDHNTVSVGEGLDRPPQDHTIVIFCHFGVTSFMAGYLLGISPVQIVQGFIMPPTSITILSSEERIPGRVQFRTQVFGDVSHLQNAGEPISASGYFTEIFNG